MVSNVTLLSMYPLILNHLVLKFKAALNPIGEDPLGQSLLGLAGSERERLSPLTHTDDLVHPRGEVQPGALYSLSKEWMADGKQFGFPF